MPDLLWSEVKDFDPDLMGALPDVSVSGTAVEDWRAVVGMSGQEAANRSPS